MSWYYRGMQIGYIAAMIATTSLVVASVYTAGHALFSGVEYERIISLDNPTATTTPEVPAPPAWPLKLEREEYNARLLDLVDYRPLVQPTSSTSSSPASDLVFASSSNVTVAGKQWPPANPYPHGGAILPFERIVAYYGNFYSRYMGILGEFDRQTVLNRLASTTAAWEAADPDTPVRPAIHYIASVAQADAGSDGMYRNVMPDAQIEHGYEMAQEIDGLLFLDLQVGLSTIQRELPQFREYLMRPDVHLGIDPEFAMAPSGMPPGRVIGTYDATDINFAINWLSEIVREHKLPPKVLVVHRFTQDMVTNYQAIQPTPEVQVVMHMDGWGSQDLKRSTYRRVIEPEPVQFVGLKIFYKNDLKPPSTGLFTPTQALQLHPEPVYVQYQ